MQNMKNLLSEISKKAIKYENFNFKAEQIQNNWLGTLSATEKQITEAETKLNVKFPDDYKKFLNITDGFSAPNDIEPSFESVEKIDYLKNVFDYVIDSFDYLPELETAIIVGGIMEEQYFLLLPPKSESENWKYWKFAHWFPGEQSFENLTEYFEDVLKFIINEHEK